MDILAYISSWVMSLFSIIFGMFGIGFLIGFHEFGHFIFCKIFKVATPTFSIGMGPRIFSKKIGETVFTLSAIPLGGYVEIAGAEDEQSDTKIKPVYLFTQKPYYQKMLVISGGILFNVLFSYIVLSTLYFVGLPQSELAFPLNESTTISAIKNDSPAEKYGLQINDTIVAINELDVAQKPIELIKFLRTHPGQSEVLTIQRNGAQERITVTIGDHKVDNKSIGYLGAEFKILRYGFFKSIKHGIQGTNKLIGIIINTFKSIFIQRNVEGIGGPLMVISQTIKGAAQGAKVFFLLLAFISVNLAVLNVIPLPIMDGGQALFYTIEAIIRRPLPEKVKIYIHYACWMLVLFLVIFLSIKDVLRIISFK
jgi:regulator of sigma E protease